MKRRTQKYLAQSLIFFASAVASSEPLQGTLTEITSSSGKTSAQFRAATTNYNLDMAKLPKESQDALRSANASNSIITIDVPPSSVTGKSQQPLGLRDDCSELPVSIDGVDKLLDSPKVNNTVDFLKALPKGTFQNYTLVYKSLSAQKGSGETGVSAMWPRVLLRNATGTITISYTCNPKSETYNDIEVLYFDTDKNELGGRTYRLNKTAGTTGPGQRADRAPTSCVSCHSTGVPIGGKLSMKHNWPEYFTWAGCGKETSIYGSRDDSMDANGYIRERNGSSASTNPDKCTSSQDTANAKTEVANFQKFKKMQADNPCYSLLPKPDPSIPSTDGLDRKQFPYAGSGQEQTKSGLSGLATRANLRFTDAYSALNVRRIAEILKHSPSYPEFKFDVALEAAGCLSEAEKANFAKRFPTKPKSSAENSDYGQGRDPRTGAPVLYGFAGAAGLRPADWSLQFHPQTDHDDPSYNGGNIFDLASNIGNEVVRDIAKNDPTVSAALAPRETHYSERTYGKQYACTDAVSDRIKGGYALGDYGSYGAQSSADDEKNKQVAPDLCASIRAAQTKDKLSRAPAADCPPGGLHTADIAAQAANSKSLLDAVRDEVNKSKDAAALASIERGRGLVQHGKANCIQCHSRTEDNIATKPSQFLFIPSDSVSKAERAKGVETLQRRVNEGFVSDIDYKLTSGDMPRGASLNEKEQKDVLAYLKSVAAEK